MATKVINSLAFGDTYVLTTPYATCSTAASTAAKVATITPGSAFSLETGVRVSVKFTNALSVAAPTLNVNSSGAKAIYFRGATLSSAQYWAAGSTVDFVFDGTYWQMLGSQHNSTYSLSSFGITSTAAELNILDGVTATAAEINKLDGLTTSTTELNYVDGVTSNIQTQLNNKSDYITSLNCSCTDGTGGYIKICKIPMTTTYSDKTLEFILASRSCKYEKVIVQLQTSNPATCTSTNILVSGDGGNYYQVHGYKYNTGTAGSEYIEIWCTLPTWDTVKIFRSYFYSNNSNSDVITWYGERSTTLPTTSTTTVKFNAELEKWSGSAANVAWSGVTSKPSYYDAKAIKGITRSGTTFTYTCMDGTTGTFSQQDNNTNTAHSHTAGTGLTVSGSGGTSGTTTYSANLNSTTSLGTIGTTSKLYAVGVDSAGKLCVNVPWTDTNTDTNTHYTTKLFATSSSGTAHAATTNGNTYLRLFDDSTARQSIKITGSGATSVTSDANGVITISSTDTNTHPTVTNSAPTLSWDTTSTVATIGGTAITVTMPANPNTNTYGRSGDTSSKIYLIGALEQSTSNKTTYSHDTAYVGTDGCLYSGGAKVLTAHQAVVNNAPTLNWNTTSTVGTVGGTALTVKLPANPNTDTINTAGASNTSSKIYLVGALSQGSNPVTYSHDTAYVGTDGCLYSGGTKVLTSHQSVSNSAPTLSWGSTSTIGTIGGTALTVTMPANPNTYGGTGNTSSKIYLMGGTTQSASNKTTYSNINCYASAGYLYSGGTKVSVEGHTHSDYASSSHTHSISSLINRTVTTTLTSSGEGGSTCTFNVPGIILNCTGTSCSSLSYNVSTTSSAITTVVTGTRSGKAGQTISAKINVTYLPCG